MVSLCFPLRALTHAISSVQSIDKVQLCGSDDTDVQNQWLEVNGRHETCRVGGSNTSHGGQDQSAQERGSEDNDATLVIEYHPQHWSDQDRRVRVRGSEVPHQCITESIPHC